MALAALTQWEKVICKHLEFLPHFDNQKDETLRQLQLESLNL